MRTEPRPADGGPVCYCVSVAPPGPLVCHEDPLPSGKTGYTLLFSYLHYVSTFAVTKFILGRDEVGGSDEDAMHCAG